MISCSVLIAIYFYYNPQAYIYLTCIYWPYSHTKTPSKFIIPKSTINIEPLFANRKDFQKIDSGPLSIFIEHKEFLRVQRTPNESCFIILPKRKKIIDVSPNHPNFFEGNQKDNVVHKDQYADLFGADINKSYYDFYLGLLKVTPESVSLTSSEKEILKATVYLVGRNSLSGFECKGAYLVKIGNIKGIQMGDPKLSDNHVTVNLFPDSITHHSIHFFGFQQTEINRILSLVQINKNSDK